MKDLDLSQEKKIKFNISVAGVQARDLRATLRIIHDGIEYGFRGEVVDGEILVTVPPLKDILPAKQDEVLTGTLEVIAGDTFLQPWSTNFRVITPVKVEAHLASVESVEPIRIPEPKPRKATKLSVRLLGE